MSTEQHYRDTLDTLTRDRVGGPDLAAAIASGRRRRRVRRTAVAGCGVAVTGLAAAVWLTVVPSDHHVVAVDPGFADAPPPADFVPGTDVDESLQTTVARHLPDLAPAADVYPSDWNTDGPIPNRDAADATEWHAVYDVSGSERLTVIMSKAIPGQPALVGCDAMIVPDDPCRTVDLPDGSTLIRSGYVLEGTTYRFMTVQVARDGSVVAETLDDVQATSWSSATDARTLNEGDLASLVQDPALTFPAPVHTPAPPSGN